MDNIIKNNINVQKFSEEILENSKVKSDLFWDRVEQNLLKALILYVTTEYSERERNLSSIYSLLASSNLKQIDMIFKGLPNKHPAKMPYNVYAQANDAIRVGVMIELEMRLQMLLEDCF